MITIITYIYDQFIVVLITIHIIVNTLLFCGFIKIFIKCFFSSDIVISKLLCFICIRKIWWRWWRIPLRPDRPRRPTRHAASLQLLGHCVADSLRIGQQDADSHFHSQRPARGGAPREAPGPVGRGHRGDLPARVLPGLCAPGSLAPAPRGDRPARGAPADRAAVVAFSVATGAEWRAIERARVEDVTAEAVLALGSKAHVTHHWDT